MYEFPCPGPITVAVRQGGGSLQVVAEPREVASVEVTPWDSSRAAVETAEHTRVELHGDRLFIDAPETGGGWLLRRSPQVRVAVRLPLDCTLQVKVASTEVRGQGRYAGVDLASASGDVAVEHVTGSVAATTASGHLLFDRVDGRFTAKAASGDVTVTQLGGEAHINTASGDVTVDDAVGSVQVGTASGDVRIGRARHGTVQIKTASGRQSVGVVQGTLVWLDLRTVSGHTDCELPTQDGGPAGRPADLTLRLRSVSGDLQVYRVSPAAAEPAAA